MEVDPSLSVYAVPLLALLLLFARSLLSGHVAINARNKDGVTPLMLAAARGHAAVVQLLVDKGADRAVPNRMRETARDIALTAGHARIAQSL